MSCECGCNNCGNGLAGLLGATLPAYSQIRAGFNLGYWVSSYSVETARQNVEDCLWGSGILYDLNVTIQPSGIGNYMIISGVTNYPFANKDDVSGAIQDALLACDTGISIVSRDAVAVDAIPAEFANNPNVQQPITYYQGNPNAKGKCDWNALSFSDYLACELGITTSQAVAVGVVGALAGVILISKLVK